MNRVELLAAGIASKEAVVKVVAVKAVELLVVKIHMRKWSS